MSRLRYIVPRDAAKDVLTSQDRQQALRARTQVVRISAPVIALREVDVLVFIAGNDQRRRRHFGEAVVAQDGVVRGHEGRSIGALCQVRRLAHPL